ncbi:MAG: hypothetical protein OXH27_07180, partial [Gammaproteobacteria bacterium]|nr:hypothetical protein [Gammaproteobacteria bacterium]
MNNWTAGTSPAILRNEFRQKKAGPRLARQTDKKKGLGKALQEENQTVAITISAGRARAAATSAKLTTVASKTGKYLITTLRISNLLYRTPEHSSFVLLETLRI